MAMLSSGRGHCNAAMRLRRIRAREEGRTKNHRTRRASRPGSQRSGRAPSHVHQAAVHQRGASTAKRRSPKSPRFSPRAAHHGRSPRPPPAWRSVRAGHQHLKVQGPHLRGAVPVQAFHADQAPSGRPRCARVWCIHGSSEDSGKVSFWSQRRGAQELHGSLRGGISNRYRWPSARGRTMRPPRRGRRWPGPLARRRREWRWRRRRRVRRRRPGDTHEVR